MHPSLTRFEVAHTQVKEFVRNKILRVVIAFIIHRGRMSRSVAAGSLASDPVHRDELTRFLARPTWRKHDFNHPLIRMLLAQEIHVSVGAPIHHRDLKRVFYTPNSAGAKHRGAEGLGLRGMSVADVDAMRSARAIPSPPRTPLPDAWRGGDRFRIEACDRFVLILPEMRRRSDAEGMHPGGSELNLATLAAVQPGSLRCSAMIATAMPADGREFTSSAQPSDHHPTGINPRRDGDRVAVACWLRVAFDGGKPQRNEESLCLRSPASPVAAPLRSLRACELPSQEQTTCNGNSRWRSVCRLARPS
jgi:hypothetical protein